MPVTLDGVLPVNSQEAEQLWQAVRQQRMQADDVVTVRVVDPKESQRLKREYKHIDQPTNVLTFSYPHPLPGKGEGKTTHDIALCLEIAEQEAQAQSLLLRNYVAWLLVHAYLHATGLDHEVSAEAAQAMQALERTVLESHGFVPYE